MRKLPKIEDITHRSSREELLDTENYSIEEIDVIYENINKINWWLGGDKPTLKALRQKVNSINKEEIFIVDVGSGGGGMCRRVSELMTSLNKKHRILGLDINDASLKIAKERSSSFPFVQYEKIDIFKKEFRSLKPDIVLSTLTFHHLKNEEILSFLNNCFAENSPTLIVNDLHRSKIAFQLFKLLGYVISFHYVNRVDGLISILRAFKRYDLIKLDKQIKTTYKDIYSSLKWRFAFRWLWIIERK